MTSIRPEAWIWCRVSTDDQRELSLDSQEAAIRKALEGQGYDVAPDHVLKVDWTSLDLASCPEFQTLHRLVLEGKINAVGVLDRDRLPAQGIQRLLFLSNCQANGVDLVTVQGSPVLDGPEGQLVELALALGKERSVRRAQQGAKDGLRDRVQLKGLSPNNAQPYGLMWEEGRLVPGPNYHVAQEIWAMALSGQKMKAIATALQRRGIPSPTGKQQWNTNTIRNILKNRAYSGTIEALGTEAVEPKHRRTSTYGKSSRQIRPQDERVRLEGLVTSPIVTIDEFVWMQERLIENQRMAKRNTHRREYLLRGLVRCMGCGRSYVGVSVTNKQNGLYSYYTCGARWQRVNSEKCPSHSLHADGMEAAVFSMIEQFLTSPEIYEGEIQRRMDTTPHTLGSLRQELEGLMRQDTVERDAEAKAFRMGSHSNVSEEVYAQEIGLIKTKRRWIDEQKQRVQGQIDDLEQSMFSQDIVTELAGRLKERLRGATAEDRRFVLESMGTKVLVQPEGEWELELHIPQELTREVQTVGSRPGLISP